MDISKDQKIDYIIYFIKNYLNCVKIKRKIEDFDSDFSDSDSDYVDLDSE